MIHPAPAHAADARVVVYTRRGCHLCDLALDVVADVCGETGDTWKQVFIEAVIMDLSVSDTLDLGVSFHGGHSVGGGPQDPLLIGGFKLFDQALIAGGQGGEPSNSLTTIVLFIYRSAITDSEFGYAAATGVFMVLVIAIPAAFYIRASGLRKELAEGDEK